MVVLEGKELVRGEEPYHAIENIEHRRTARDQLDQHDRCLVLTHHLLHGRYSLHRKRAPDPTDVAEIFLPYVDGRPTGLEDCDHVRGWDLGTRWPPNGYLTNHRRAHPGGPKLSRSQGAVPS